MFIRSYVRNIILLYNYNLLKSFSNMYVIYYDFLRKTFKKSFLLSWRVTENF